MEPTFYDGDLLLVDRGVSVVEIDGIYVLSCNDELFIKTIQRRPGRQLRVISDNKTYDPWDINPEDQSCRILGKVVWAWNGKKL
jgi:phage repressor protein C with HTH and peptisase S24 domain